MYYLENLDMTFLNVQFNIAEINAMEKNSNSENSVRIWKFIVIKMKTLLKHVVLNIILKTILNKVYWKILLQNITMKRH